MGVLDVSGLYKSYPYFQLKNVSFSLEKGKITGFIGRNGAGKTTTLKSVMGFVHPDAGEIGFFGKSFHGHGLEIKQKIGFVSGGVDYYSKKKIRNITAVTKDFYRNWDGSTYTRLMKLFNLDENKCPSELSAGMKVKYNLALALSHKAELLILDEPTSGLDPVSRDDILELFMELSDGGATILFSTHITSDLDKCADNILYIKEGGILAESGIKHFIEGYRVAEYSDSQLTDALRPLLIGSRRGKTGHTALIRSADEGRAGVKCRKAGLESIMVHIEKDDNVEAWA